MTEAELQDALACVSGHGQWWAKGPGLTSHTEGDENQQRIHACMLELERRGLVRRAVEDAAGITWAAT